MKWKLNIIYFSKWLMLFDYEVAWDFHLKEIPLSLLKGINNMPTEFR